MNLTKPSIANPIAVLVAVLLALIFGFLSLERLPVQLTPEVEKLRDKFGFPGMTVEKMAKLPYKPDPRY